MKRILAEAELEVEPLSIWKQRKSKADLSTTTTTTSTSLNTPIDLTETGKEPMPIILDTKKKFRMNAKGFFLTFPQCTVSKEIVLERLTASMLKPKLDWAVIAQESHQSGDLHLHLGLFFNVKLNIRKADYFDFLAEKHGNLQTMKSVKGTLNYLRKEDKTPLIYGEPPVYSGEVKVAKAQKIALMVRSGSSLDEVEAEEPGYFMLNMRKIIDYQSFCLNSFQRKSLKPMQFPLVYIGSKPDTQVVVDWLNTEFALYSTFQVSPDVRSWSTELLEVIPYRLFAEVYDGISDAVSRGFLRFVF